MLYEALDVSSFQGRAPVGLNPNITVHADSSIHQERMYYLVLIYDPDECVQSELVPTAQDTIRGS
jgi:hypothetical protein